MDGKVRITLYTRQGHIYSYLTEWWEEMPIGIFMDPSSDGYLYATESLSQSDDCPPIFFRTEPTVVIISTQLEQPIKVVDWEVA